MEDKGSSVKNKLVQLLEELHPSLTATLQSVRSSGSKGDLEALSVLFNGSGTCRFKGEAWTDSLPLRGTDQRTTILRLLLVLLLQEGKLKQLRHDPGDLRITKPIRKIVSKEPEKEVLSSGKNESEGSEISKVACTNEEEEISAQVDESNIPSEAVGDANSCDSKNEDKQSQRTAEDDSESSDEEEAFDENGNNFLIGPRIIDLKRTDEHHPLFSTYRKSTHLRVKIFLNSKHILFAKKLSGIDVYDYGYDFNRDVLVKTGPSLEDLQIDLLREERDLELLRDIPMPKLRRLNVWVEMLWDSKETPVFVFPPSSPCHVGLRWLRARLPKPALESLLRNNSKTLQEIELGVGTAQVDNGGFPMRCDDLDSFLVDCGLAGSLRRLVLIRGSESHSRDLCQEQVNSIRRSMPEVTVVCNICCPDSESWYVTQKSGGWRSY